MSTATDEILEPLLQRAQTRSLAANQFLFQQADHQTSLFILRSGLVELAMNVPGRGPVAILCVGPGELIAWSAVLSKQPMTCSAKAIEDSILLEIPADAIETLASQNPSFAHAFFRWIALALSERLTATRLQLLDLFDHPNA
jgi:CRP-like cAMP-binding protein